MIKHILLVVGTIFLLSLPAFGQATISDIPLTPASTKISWSNETYLTTNYSPKGDHYGGGWTTACGTTVKFADDYNWDKARIYAYYPSKRQASVAFMYRRFGTVAIARARAKSMNLKYGSVIIIEDIKTDKKEWIPLIVEDCYRYPEGCWYSRFKAHGTFDICYSHAKKAPYGMRKVRFAIVGYINDPKYISKNRVMGWH